MKYEDETNKLEMKFFSAFSYFFENKIETQVINLINMFKI